ncbi:MAG TPA: ABC transporter ATP-binding protein/permease [Nevskia sp.]|nr:ABC transporter ATP-binding protein/permease [Nevskia sp.]
MSDSSAQHSPPLEEAPHPGLGLQLGLVLGALRGSAVRRTLLSLVVAIVLVLVLTAYAQIRLNSWNKPFFDALSRRDLRDFFFQLGVFAIIISGLLILNVAQRYLVETLKWRLREGLVQDLVARWMQPRRAFWLAHRGSMGVNPDQRMHEDARKLCELSADLGVGLSQSSILFVTFAGVLWVLSEDFSLHIGGEDYPVPGFMLWAAILYAGGGSLLSYLVGRTLINRNAERYAREADLRFSLVRINEHLDGISLAGGEADERRRVEQDLGDVLAATRRLVTGLTNLTWITAGFGWVTVAAPILVAAPLFFAGKITFGGVMMAAAAFTQAQSSLRWFVDNFSIIADWRATLLRVAGFRQALVADNAERGGASHIGYAEGPAGELLIEDLVVDSPGGRDALSERQVRVRAGERLLVAAAPGTGKTQLFRALAGLWPWGSGRVTMPAGEAVHYMPRGTPYLPRGSLREVLAYPLDAAGFSDEACARALARLGLERLQPLLDARQRWDRELSQDEQQGLAFARLALQAPPWVLIDDAFGALDAELMTRIASVLQQELAHTGLIHIGRAAEGQEQLFGRVLHLVKAGADGAPPRQDAGAAP